MRICFSAAEGSNHSAASSRRVSRSVSSFWTDQLLLSALASMSMSSTSRDMREHSCEIVWAKRSACSGEARRMTDALVPMTARGARSSWEAAETNSICLRRLSSTGRMANLTKNHQKMESSSTAAAESPVNAQLRRAVWACSGALGLTRARETHPPGIGTDATAA